MKILYVEDNPANVALVKRVARMGSHEIINYIDGDQALAKFDEIDPDLVLMDIQLAGEKTGLDVVKTLRSRGVTKTIIAVTAYAMVGDKERALDAGCDDYLPKPLPISRLIEIFKNHADRVANEQANVVASKPDAVEPAKQEEDTTPDTAVATSESSNPASEARSTTHTETPVATTLSEEKSDDAQAENVDKGDTISNTVTLNNDDAVSTTESDTTTDDVISSIIISQPDPSSDETTSTNDDSTIIDEPAKN